MSGQLQYESMVFGFLVFLVGFAGICYVVGNFDIRRRISVRQLLLLAAAVALASWAISDFKP